MYCIYDYSYKYIANVAAIAIIEIFILISNANTIQLLRLD